MCSESRVFFLHRGNAAGRVFAERMITRFAPGGFHGCGTGSHAPDDRYVEDWHRTNINRTYLQMEGQ